MEWNDEAIVLSARPHGETSAVAELFTREHGRHLGLVRGGRSRRVRPTLQVGNHVDAHWKARLADHLGNLSLELRTPHAAAMMENKLALAAITSLAALARLLPERDPHPSLYEITQFVIGYLDQDDVWPALMVRWELALLGELGVGLELGQCAVTGTNDRLTHVSPKTGRAVSASAAEPYRERLLLLPAFLVHGGASGVSEADVANGFALTGHFLQTRFFNEHGRIMPDARQRMLQRLAGR